MKKKIFKIVTTIFILIFSLEIIYLAVRFFSALWDMDDDLMFIYGLTLMVVVSFLNFLEFIGTKIAYVWTEKDKGDNK